LEPGKDYIDHCVETVAAIDPEEFAQRELGELIGRNVRLFGGSGASTYELGKMTTAHGLLDIAFKESDTDAEWRMKNELRDTAIVLSRSPELLEKFPYFTGLIAIEGAYISLGIVTEDASRGGLVPVRETRMSEETLGTILNGAGDEIFIDDDTLEFHTTFDAGGEERILDLAPSIFGLAASSYVHDHADFAEIHTKTNESLDKLTIWIPSKSPLALSITGE